jgi:hypothetical protein
MVAEDFLQDPGVRKWLDGVEPAWTLRTFDSLRALRAIAVNARRTDHNASAVSACSKNDEYARGRRLNTAQK